MLTIRAAHEAIAETKAKAARKLRREKLQGAIADLTPEAARQRHVMLDVAIAYVLTPQRAVRIAKKIADIACMDSETNPADVGAAVAAAKFLAERVNGKPRQNVETNTTQTLTLEKRQEIVHRFFGIEPSDATLQFGTKLDPQVGATKAPLALPGPVLDKYEPKGLVEEESPDRGDVCQRLQEREEAGVEEARPVAAGSLVQQQGREE